MQRRITQWYGARPIRLSQRQGFYTRQRRAFNAAVGGQATGTVKRALGNYDASKRGVDRTDVVLKGMLQIPVEVNVDGSGETKAGNNCGMVALPVWQLLQNTKYWSYYKDLFQQVQLSGFSAKITGNNAGSVVLASGLSSVTTFIGYDRNGINGWIDVEKSKVTKDDDVGTYEYMYMVQYGKKTETMKNKVMAAVSNGTVRQKAWSPGNAFYTHVSCFPSSMTEKQEIVDTANMGNTLVLRVDNENSTDKDMPYRILQVGFPSGLDSSSINSMTQDSIVEGDGENMGYKLEKNYNTYLGTAARGVEWDPVILIGVFNVPSSDYSNAKQVFTFTMDFSCMCSFRGTKDGTWDLGDNNKKKSITLTGQTLNLNITENGIIQRMGQYNNVLVDVRVPQNVSKQDIKFLNLWKWQILTNPREESMTWSFPLEAVANWTLLIQKTGDVNNNQLMTLNPWTVYVFMLRASDGGDWRIIAVWNASGVERTNFSPSAIFGISSLEGIDCMFSTHVVQDTSDSTHLKLALSSSDATHSGDAVAINVGKMDMNDGAGDNTEYGEIWVTDYNMNILNAGETLERLQYLDEQEHTQPDDSGGA